MAKIRKVGLPKGGTTGQVLKKTSGTDYDTEWGTGGGGGGTPGGSDTQVQFNDGGAFGGDAGLTYNKTTDILTTGGLNLSGENASRIASLDASKNLKSLDTATYPSLSELAYVKGATSGIQTQIDGKQATLVSATNIKTINGNSVLGSGNLVIPEATSSNVLIDCGTFTAPNENLLIDCGSF